LAVSKAALRAMAEMAAQQRKWRELFQCPERQLVILVLRGADRAPRCLVN